jgi:proteasome lid subunit RPN8/RPN11
MEWRELTPDIKMQNLGDALRSFDCLSALTLLINFTKGIRLYVSRRCLDEVLNHVRAEKHELGGLLLGRAYHWLPFGDRPEATLTIITDCAPSLHYRSSSVSLEMSSEVWRGISDRLTSGSMVIGWYHSHPNLGAFFSGIDRRTQMSFFNYHYSIGWVIDPFRDEQRVFCAGKSQEYEHSLVVVDHGLEMAEVN